jgi:molybdenum cofactor biosynthesis enzyme
MDDLSREIPVQRMSVASGRLVGIGDAGFDIGVVEAAAKLGVKQAALYLPDLHVASASHIQVDLEGLEDGAKLIVTVQAHARASMEMYAMAGVVHGLLAARDAAGCGSITEVELIQNVE